MFFWLLSANKWQYPNVTQSLAQALLAECTAPAIGWHSRLSRVRAAYLAWVDADWLACCIHFAALASHYQAVSKQMAFTNAPNALMQLLIFSTIRVAFRKAVELAAPTEPGALRSVLQNRRCGVARKESEVVPL